MRILVVDDEKEISDGIQAILHQEGYETDAVYDGEDGLNYSLTGIYDLILLDIMLPGKTGFEILRTIKEKGLNVPIILLTAKNMTEDKIKGLDYGADDYLTKPFDSGELLARIRARLRGNGGAFSGPGRNQLSVYDIVLDQSTYRLSHEDRSVKLSHKEFEFMEYLMMNKGIILPRDTIAARVWGLDDDGDYNNTAVYVSFLRKKLKFIGAKAAIITKKEVGYSLESNDGKESA
ncbi:MAG: response regulator transcription factor [Lachnospiraceae bacterium]|nr:response regulator transcription factor [Lachnospiraceae bacterium]